MEFLVENISDFSPRSAIIRKK